MRGCVLVTGATGFVGHAVLQKLLKTDRRPLVAAVRNNNEKLPSQLRVEQIGELCSSTDWMTCLQGVDVVIHCAARAHVMDDRFGDPLDEYRRVNLEGTLALAQQAAQVGTRRFIFISSIKVNGEFTVAGRPFTADDVPSPKDAYGISKYEAEQALRQISACTGMEVVIIRPPLVYGPNVKANFATMMRWLARGFPLPLAAVTENRRSLVALDNLVDLVMTCLNHPAAANQTFLLSDGEDLSTADLLRRMGTALAHPARLFYTPLSLLKLGTKVANIPGIYQRLCGSLQLDIAKTRHLLGWTPPVSVDEGLRRAAEGFRK